jgi:hypothetical protein
MKMQARLAIVASRNVSHQAQHFALLADIDRLVFPGAEVEPPDLGSGKRADRRYRRPIQTLLVGEFRDRLESFLTLIQNQDRDALRTLPWLTSISWQALPHGR